MKMSRRALRMERHHQRRSGAGAMNLVSLMDIFTILVFFLLVNSTEVDVLPSTNMITLPESVAMERPREAVVVMVTAAEILVQGRSVAGIGAALADHASGIPALSAALDTIAQRRVRAAAGEGSAGLEVTIVGEKDLPYRLLKKIMIACTEAGYGQVSFAVMQKPPGEV
jgi:biopolymer transport protein ExbD